MVNKCHSVAAAKHLVFLCSTHSLLIILQVNEYKYEIERLVRELNDMKRRYFEQKRRDQMEREKGLKPVAPPSATTNQARFTGGGFSLSQQA